MSQRRRVVVTGIGMLTPVGNDVQSSWQNILAAKSGAALIENFDTSELPVKFAAQLKNFDISQFLTPKDTKKMDPFIQYGLVATEEALKDSGLEITDENADRIGVALSSGIGGINTITEQFEKFTAGGARKISPFFIPSCIINMLSGFASIRHNLKGPNIAIVSACTTGSHNIGYAARTIAYGDADVMVAGGAEMATSGFCMSGFAAARALSTRNDDPEAASRPWDRDRDGFLFGEGAGTLILEEYEHAKKRGATIYAEVLGFGMSADAYHITSPDKEGDGFVACMTNAIRDAGLNASDIDYINAHGTSTPTGDTIESNAVKRTFGDHAYQLCMSSTKSMTGHLLGAAGAIEAIFTILALRDQVAPPTINLDNPDEGCDLNYVAHEAQSRELKAVLSNSFGFGGTNASVIFSKVD